MGLRQLFRVVVWLIIAVGIIVLFTRIHAVQVLKVTLTAEEVDVVLRTLLILIAVLIPTCGIFSVLNQYGFWTGWLGYLPSPDDVFAERKQNHTFQSLVVYLDGIHQSEADHPPRIRLFLRTVQDRLPANVFLLTGLEAYTAKSSALQDDIGSAWFWRRLFALQESHLNPVITFITAFLVQANNVIKVGISADRRYGPIINYELALKVAEHMARLGFTSAEQEVVLLGYSGGGEMAMGLGDYLRRIADCRVRVVTFCGVFSGNQLLDNIGVITTINGSRDPVAAFGRVAFPGRLALLPLSNWNRARARGQVQRLMIKGMNHNGRRGPFSDRYRDQLADVVVDVVSSQRASGNS